MFQDRMLKKYWYRQLSKISFCHIFNFLKDIYIFEPDLFNHYAVKEL